MVLATLTLLKSFMISPYIYLISSLPYPYITRTRQTYFPNLLDPMINPYINFPTFLTPHHCHITIPTNLRTMITPPFPLVQPSVHLRIKERQVK